ncbi:MAG: ADOP family duplicated permease [Gemmatimonadales bacterium]
MRLRLRLSRLHEVLAASRISQNHWAIRVGISRGHWSELVNGKHPYPSARTRGLLLDALGLTVEELFDVETGPTPAEGDFRRAIADQYLIDAELGQGGMGTVYQARDARLGRVVAIKVISPEAVSGIGLVQFQREISTIAQLQHPGILPLLDAGEVAGHPYFVMPLVRGGSLRDRLAREGRLSLATVQRLVRGIAAALHHAHGERILHCDVKPANVLLHGDHTWVTDFGIARKLHDEIGGWRSADGLDLSAGTPAYVSPEQATGEADLDARSDVYSLACLTYEMLAGRPPFEGDSTQAVVARRFLVPPSPLREVAPEVPPAVDRIIETALAVSREDRPPTAVAFAEQLEQAVAGPGRLLDAVSLRVARLAHRVSGRQAARRSTGAMAWARDVGRDLAVTVRSLRRAPGYAGVVILTLGLALGANGTMFGIVDRLMLRPPAAVERPEGVRRVYVARFFDGSLQSHSPSLSYPAFEALRDQSSSFSAVAAFTNRTVSLGLGVEARELQALAVTGRFFALLGTPVAIGRAISDADDRLPAGARVVVLADGLWRTRFGADSGIIGQTVQLHGQPWTVIGVAPPGFTGPQLERVDLFLPFTALFAATQEGDNWRTSRGWQYLRIIGRLAPGVTAARADDEATLVYQAAHRAYREYEEKAVVNLRALLPEQDPQWRSPEARVAAWLSLMAAVVLLIACANLASLGLARGMSRTGEVAVRRALGVTRARLIRQFVTESLVLCLLGAGVGLFIASVGGRLVRTTMFPGLLWSESVLDGRIVLATALATMGSAVVAGVIPLLRGSATDLSQALHASNRRSTGRLPRLLNTLLVTQVGLATVLLAGAGLFVQSVREVGKVDLGIRPGQAIAVNVSFDHRTTPDDAVNRFYREAAERVRLIPGVTAAGAAIGGPFLNNYATQLRIPGVDSIPPLAGGGPYYYRMAAGALEALGPRLLRGRLFTAADEAAGAAPVAIVTDLMVRTIWPNRDPLAQCLIVEDRPCAQVVGVVADMHRDGIREAAFMQYFLPLAEDETAAAEGLFVSAAADPARLVEPIRRVLHDLRGDLPFASVEPYEALIAPQARSWRLGASMLSAFGLLSLAMAVIGVYGMLAFLVTRQRSELGVRAALGATPGRLLRQVLIRGVGTTAVGVGLGLAASVAVAGRLDGLLFNVSARDPLVLGAAAVTVLGAATAAALIPGRRAALADPLAALRSE